LKYIFSVDSRNVWRTQFASWIVVMQLQSVWSKVWNKTLTENTGSVRRNGSDKEKKMKIVVCLQQISLLISQKINSRLNTFLIDEFHSSCHSCIRTTYNLEWPALILSVIVNIKLFDRYSAVFTYQYCGIDRCKETLQIQQ
jgi:hypothetical protein